MFKKQFIQRRRLFFFKQKRIIFRVVLGFFGMAYSFYPFIVPEQLTIYEAASAPESLFIILIGTCFVLPMILGYTALAYTVFRGKATTLSYE